jgi:hypothetical protein
MTYGNFYYGPAGFFYKKMGGAGGRKNPPIGTICNQPQNIYNKYVPGSGVGASSTSQRRAKLINAYKTQPQSCGQCATNIGLYQQGGSNVYALNWFIYADCKKNPNV